jgi:hypothetical protein
MTIDTYLQKAFVLRFSFVPEKVGANEKVLKWKMIFGFLSLHLLRELK